MNVLLDECLPKQLKQIFSGYKLKTVPEMGWAGKTNGELLRLAEKEFEVFITIDQNLQYQQNLKKSSLAVVLLTVKNNRYESIVPLIPNTQHALKTIQAGQLIRIKS